MGTATSSTNSFLAVALGVWILSASPQEMTISGAIASTRWHMFLNPAVRMGLEGEACGD